MNKYKSLILIGLFTVGLSSCKTDDLEKDLDALKERVENFEMQVQRLNDEMNIIRVLLDGNKTITDYAIDGNKYTLTLSNGETVTLTDGQNGKSYPIITIGENGNWFVNGEDTGNRAEANDGSDVAVTPKFKIENGNWWVSYDGGNNYKDLGVKATGDGATSESPITDFKAENGRFTFTIGGKDYVIPVVEGLICKIVDKNESYNVAQSQTLELKVKVNLKTGDIVRPIVPVEWKASVSDYSSLTGEQELTVKVTAPATAIKCVLSVEVTRGVNTATDEVILRTATASYYDDYMAGLDIQVGNVIINKFTHGDAQSVESGAISTDGVYFVKKGASNIVLKGGKYGKLIVIGEKNGELSNITLESSISVGSTSGTFGVALKGIKVKSDKVRPFNLTASENTTIVVENLILDACHFSLGESANMSYLYDKQWKTTLNNLYTCSSKIGVYKNVSNKNGIYNPVEIWNCRAGIFKNITIKNNIIYCNVDNSSSILTIAQSGKDTKAEVNGEVKFESLIVENNTFMNISGNIGGSSSGMIRTTMIQGYTMKNNLFWYNKECFGNEGSIVGINLKSHLMLTATFFNSQNLGNNIVYSESKDTKLGWQYFRNVPNDNVESGFKNDIAFEATNPFTEGTVPHTGKFTYTDEFKSKGIGANIK